MIEIVKLLKYLYYNRYNTDIFENLKTSNSLEVVMIKKDCFGKLYYVCYKHSFNKSFIEIDLRDESSIFNIKINEFYFYYCDYGNNKFINVSIDNNKNYIYLFSYNIDDESIYEKTINSKLKIFMEEENIENLSDFDEELLFYLKLKEII